jgi:predicted enzyme related to lactoylglutathione lyase
MSNTVIFIPVNERSVALKFYEEVMQFTRHGSDFYPSKEETSVRINLLDVNEQDRRERGLEEVKARFPIFRYYIERNFLSHCRGIVGRGGNFEMAREHPGGYFARIIDPFGNTFEIMCDSFDESDNLVEPFNWPFFDRY